jgi:hypothetical protein
MMSKWILRGVAIASVLVSYNCRSRNRNNDNATPTTTTAPVAPTTAPAAQPAMQPGVQPGMPQPGMPQPGMPPGVQPGMQPGMQPADPTAQPGLQPMQPDQPAMPGGDYIVSQMQMRQAQYAVGMTPVLPIARGTLTTSGTQNYAVSMVPGRCYKIIGVGAPSVTDLDLKLYAPANPDGTPSALVDQDVAEDNYPVIGLARERPLCPTIAGVYRLEVTMYSGAGEFGVQVFGGAQTP